MNRKLPDVIRIQTDDGTATLRDQALGVSYRSLSGAELESTHVFVSGSELDQRSGSWRILELGFGAGTNFDRSVAAAVEHGVDLEYWAVERAPIEPTWLCASGRARVIAERALESVLHSDRQLHTVRDGNVTFNLVVGEWVGAALPADVHAVYFDPFAPAVDPESWSVDAFATAAECLAPDGVLVTYSAASGVRRAMAEAGLEVASRPGIGSKREMTVAHRADSRPERSSARA